MGLRRELWGFWFEPSTGLVFPSEEGDKPINNWTFNDLWFESFGWNVRSRPLPFFYAPTKETAELVFAWAKALVGGHAQLRLQKEEIKRNITGAWSHPEWSIYAAKTKLDAEDAESDPFSVGLIAQSILRHGPDKNSWAAKSFITELQHQGAWLE